MKRFPRLVSVLIVSSSLVGNVSRSGAAPAPLAALVKGNTAFALDLYQREKDKSVNLFFSPCNVSTALAMTYAGAQGQTAEEMARTLHFDQPPAEIHQAFGDLSARFDQIRQQKEVNLSVANSLWFERNYSFLPEFMDLSRKYYHVEAQPADFVGNSEAARLEINSWVEKKTNDKIKDLLKPGQVGAMTRLVLCSAIYFKGDWATQFDPKSTSSQPFYSSPDKTVTVPMMTRQFKVRSLALEGFHCFALPYVGNELSMVVLLPDDRAGLGALESRLNAGALQGWLESLDGAPELDAIVALPKFKLNCRMDLGADLAAMGMPEAFGPQADFSGMDGKRDLFIASVVHQAFVDVNEQGTEAAAATGVTIRTLSVRRPLALRADHPFLFLIVEQKTRSVLFIGRVTDPSR